MGQSCMFKTAYGQKETFVCSSGDKEFPVFGLNEKGDVVDTGKKTDVDALIQSYKDSVLLENIIRRASVTGDTLEAPAECFGDSRVLPQNLLDAKMKADRVQSFVDGLSDSDLALLNEKGFDDFLRTKISDAAKANAVNTEGGDKNE